MDGLFRAIFTVTTLRRRRSTEMSSSDHVDGVGRAACGHNDNVLTYKH
jgi:hypothetical protein